MSAWVSPYAGFCRFVFKMISRVPLVLPSGIARFRERENQSASKDLRVSLRESGLGLEPSHVVLAAYATAAMVAVLAMATAAFIVRNIPGILGDPVGVLLLVLGVAVAPVVALGGVAAYPGIVAGRLRASAQGRMPEVVQYLAMSLRVTPSLSRAIAFAAAHVDEPLASSLRRILWRVQVRASTNHEEAFLDMAQEWGAACEGYKRALYAIRASLLERTPESMQAMLEKAVAGAHRSATQRMETFAARLAGPTFILFALGVVLPMVIGSMLPMAGIGGIDIGPEALALLLVGLFPAVTAAYATRILADRPGTLPPPSLGNGSLRRRNLAWGAIVGGFLLAPGLPPLDSMVAAGAASNLRLLPYLWAPTGALATILLLQTTASRRMHAEVMRLEREFPDALFQLGSRIADGMALELALERTADSMRGTEVARLFRRIHGRSRLTRDSLDSVLFGTTGILRGHPSAAVRATMAAVVAAAGKDAVGAGRTITGIGEYLRDLLRMEHEIRTRLSQVVDTMRTTAMFFAPIVLGITTALYGILGGVLQGVRGVPGVFAFAGQPRTSPDVFTLLLGTYLVLSATILLWFVARMRDGQVPGSALNEIGRGVPVALTVFSVATLAGAGLG